MALSDLFSVQTATSVLNWLLDAANAQGLVTTTWRVGDPARTLFGVTAERFATYELVSSEFIKSGFLDWATGDWLTEHARQRYGVERIEGSHAVVDVVLTNTGGGVFVLDPGDVTVAKASDQQITYHSTTGGTLLAGPGTALTLTFECDVEGSEGSADADELTTLVTTLLGVTATNPVSTAANDEESDEALRQRCRDSLAALSPNGPAEAYRYVALTPSLTGTSEPTRAKVVADSPAGHVTVYVTSADGTISSGAVDLVEAAIVAYATPLTVTPIVVAATPVTVDIEYGLDIRSSSGLTSGEVEDLVETALRDAINSREIGGDEGEIALSVLVAAVHATNSDIVRVTILDPPTNIELDSNEVAVLGTATAAEINFI